MEIGAWVRNAAGMIGSAVSSVIGGVVNVATPLISAAATLVDGAIIGVGEGVVSTTGATVTGATGLIDILCGWIRGAMGTVGGYLNNSVKEIVKVVGGEDTSKQLEGDSDFKKFFGDFGASIKAAFEKSGGLTGVRSLLAWPSKSLNWGNFKPSLGDSDKTEDKPVKEDKPVAEDKPATEDKPSANDNPSAEDKPSANDNDNDNASVGDKPTADGILVWVDADGNVVPVDVVDGNLVPIDIVDTAPPSADVPTQSPNLADELLGPNDDDDNNGDDGAAVVEPVIVDPEENLTDVTLDDVLFDEVDVPAFDGFVTQANNDNLFDGASALAAVA